jgi:DNA-binding PadR family transcriptional regulator
MMDQQPAVWFPTTINALKISRLFVAEPLKKRWAYDIKTELKIPEETARSVLHVMHKNKWLDAEEEQTQRSLLNRSRRVLYRITDHGLHAAIAALNSVQIQGQVLFPAST